MKSIFLPTVKKPAKKKTYPKRVRLLVYKKSGLLLVYIHLCA